MPHFPNLIGSDEMKERIGEAVARGRLSHAYLIEGRAGSGRRTLALSLAAAANCDRRRDGVSLPCGVCPSCRKVLDRKTPDVHILERGERATISVEAVRELRYEMGLSATELDTSVFIICDADTMTAAAQNALLVALEEPPRAVLFLLLCESAEGMLTTIRSRVQLLRMGYVNRERMREHLLTVSPEAKRLAADENKLDALLTAADGRIGEALRLLSAKTQNELFRRRSLVRGLVLAFTEARSYSAVLSAISSLPSKRSELFELFPMILDAMRDLCAVRRAPNAPLLFFSDRADARAIAGRADYVRLFRNESAVRAAGADIAANANVQTVLTSLATTVFGRA